MRILLQVTTPYAADDWNVNRFGLLRAEMANAANVTARNREPVSGGSDPLLLALPESDYDQIWIMGVDAGNGLTTAECAAISRFRATGGGVFSTRDHMDLGSSLCELGGIGPAHYFHSTNPEPNVENRVNDDTFTTTIGWPNYHSGANGDVQVITAADPAHPVLRRRGSRSGTIDRLPAHPHEGSVGAPPLDETARVIVTGRSKVSGRAFNIAVAFEPPAGSADGRGWAESTFHHFCDYNWDVSLGCPSFVAEPPSDAIAKAPGLLDDTKDYVRNLIEWLGPRQRRA